MIPKIGSARLSEFFEIARALTSTSDLDALLRKIGTAAQQLTGTAASSIMLLDDDKQSLFFKAAGGEKGALVTKLRVRLGEGIAGWVAQNREPLVIQDVTKDPRFTGRIDKTSGFETRSILCVPMILNGELIGVVEVLNKSDGSAFTDEDTVILTGLANFVATSIVNARYVALQQNFFANIFEILTHSFESKEPVFAGHSFRVAQISTSIARALGIDGQEYRDIHYAAILHDIGFLNMPEYSVMDHGVNREHPVYGFEMVNNIILLKQAGGLIKCHHELYDGSGFPAGLKADAVPRGARIISLVEFVEDMRFSGNGADRINEFVKAQKGNKFDPAAAEAYLGIAG
jgi:putative nucleotidyltransferase with HDIG domain